MSELESVVVPLRIAMPAPRPPGRLAEARSIACGLLVTAVVGVAGTVVLAALLVLGVVASPVIAAVVAWVVVRHRRLARARTWAAIRTA